MGLFLPGLPEEHPGQLLEKVKEKKKEKLSREGGS